MSDSVFDHCGDAGILAGTDRDPAFGGGPVYVTVTNTDFIGHPTNGCGDADGGCYGVLIDSHGGSFTAENVTVTGMRWDSFLLAFNEGDAVIDVSDSSISDTPGEGMELFVRPGWTADVTITDTVFSNVEGIALWGGTPADSTYTITRSEFLDGTRAVDLNGSLTLTDSTISNNNFVGVGWYGGTFFEATGSTFVGNDYYGLELFPDPGATARIVNSTITGNVGGLLADDDLDLFEIVNSTITGNTDYGFETYAATTNIVNTIVYGNTLDCLLDTNFPITSLGNNIEGDGSCTFGAAGDQVGVDPLLGPLQDNGGPTHTMAIGVGSPALDAETTASVRRPTSGAFRGLPMVTTTARSSATSGRSSFPARSACPWSSSIGTSIPPIRGWRALRMRCSFS